MLSSYNKNTDEDIQLIYAYLDNESGSPLEEDEIKIEEMTSFHRNQITLYLDSLETHKKARKESDKISFKASETFYESLIDKFPLYPDAYLEMAELFAKNKDPENAIAYYETYLKIAPFDLSTAAKLAQQRDILNKLYPDNPPYSNNNFSTALKAATEGKHRENNFRKWYHISLRKQLLVMNLPISAPIMDPKLSDNTDYTDPSLTNGAVLDNYFGHKATALNQHFLANFYHQKAILKFKDDFFSISNCAFNYHLEGDTAKAIKELNACIEKYHHCLPYLKRYLIHMELDEIKETKADLITFLNIGEKTDFITLLNIGEKTDSAITPSYRRALICILNDEPYISYPNILRQLTSEQIEVMTERISLSIKTIEGKRYKGNYTYEIQTITKLLTDEPYNGKYYAWRAFFYLHAGEYENAKLNYSLAIVFSPEDNCSEFYFGRIIVNLITGDMERVRYDLNNIIYLYNNSNDTTRVLKFCERFAKQCTEKSKMHLEKGNFYLAEAVSRLGLEKHQCIDLYLNFAIACGFQEKYDDALKILSGLKPLKIIDKNTLATIERYRNYFLDHSTSADSNSNSSTPEKKPQDCKSTVEKVKKKPKKPHAVKLNRHQPKKSSASTTFIQTLLADAANVEGELDEIILEEEKIAQELRKAKEFEKKIKEKMRIKAKKSKLHERRKSTHADENNEDNSGSETENDKVIPDDSYLTQIPASINPFYDHKPIILELRDCEKAVFNLFASCKLQHPQQKFKTYIVGGWAYDRVREHLFKIAPPPKQKSDFDMVTELPMETLQAQLPTFKVVPKVRGLLRGKVAGYQVDIIHRQSLSPLIKDANSRDFYCVYMDEDGRIHDPTGFAILYMKDNLLKSVAPVCEVFKKDPLIILRAVYHSTKRNLRMTDLKKQIKIDKGLLVPRLGNQEVDILYHPHRFNVLIRKNFSEQMALKNYDLMDKLGLLEILFPHIYFYLQIDNEWMRAQMQTTDCVEWPKLEIIYANMIACAVMQQVNEKLNDCVAARLKETNLIFGSALAHNPEIIAAIITHTEFKLIEYYTAQIIKQSLLFSQLEKLPLFINKSIDQWKLFQMLKNPSDAMQKAEPALEASAEKQQIRRCP